MVAVCKVLVDEERSRRLAGRRDHEIPFRPDHGHELLSDVDRKTFPGYPIIGRMRGLAEVRGILHALNYDLRS
jgi:mannonate dehydratase